MKYKMAWSVNAVGDTLWLEGEDLMRIWCREDEKQDFVHGGVYVRRARVLSKSPSIIL